MKKKLLSTLSIFSLFIFIIACSDDDNKGLINASTLTVDGKVVEVTDLEAEYDDGEFNVWVNDVATTDKRVYIQASFKSKEDIDAGTDITSIFDILFQRNGGVEYFVGEGKKNESTILGDGYYSYRGGDVVLKEIDKKNKTLTIEFKEAKYRSNLRNIITIDGTVSMNYTVLKYGNDK